MYFAASMRRGQCDVKVEKEEEEEKKKKKKKKVSK